MPRALYLGRPDIQFDSTVTTASSEDSDYPHENTYFAGSSVYWKTSSAVTSSNITYDLGSGNTGAIDYCAIRGLNLMTANDDGNIDITVAGSTDNFSASNVTVLSKTGISATDLQGPNSEDYFLSNYDNLFPAPNAFDDAAWAKTQLTISADNTTAPDGTSTADKLTPTAVSNIHRAQETFTPTSGVTYTMTVFMKYGGYHGALEFGAGGFPATPTALFDLSLGQVASITAGDSATIEHIKDGWYKCTLTSTSDATALSGAHVYVTQTPTGSFTYTGDASSHIFAWGAHLSASYETLSTAYRYWRVTLDSTASFKHLARNIYLGRLFGFGDRSPIYPYSPQYNAALAGSTSNTGAIYQSSRNLPRREYQFTWNLVTDTNRNTFDSDFVRYRTEHPYILHQPEITTHSPINNNRLIFAWLTSVQHESGEWRNLNNVNCTFVEDIV